MSHQLSKLWTNQNGVLSGCTKYFDWLKVYVSSCNSLVLKAMYSIQFHSQFQKLKQK